MEDEHFFVQPEETDYDQDTVRLNFHMHPDIRKSIEAMMMGVTQGCSAEFEAQALVEFPNGHRASVLRIHGCHARAMLHAEEGKPASNWFEVYKSTDSEPQKWLSFRDVQAHLHCLARQPERVK